MYYSYDKRDYTYDVTSPPAQTPITLAEAKQQLRITGTAEDALITQYIQAATNYAENFTRRDFITRTYRTYRDCFPSYYGFYGYGNVGFEIRRSRLQSIVQISYLTESGTSIVSPSVYYNTLQSDYSWVLSNPGQSWPDDAEKKLQSIFIDFTCGYGDNPSDVPEDIRVALMEIVTALNENRGDCSGDACSANTCSGLAPGSAKSTLLQRRIENL